MTSITNLGETILGKIQQIGYVYFAILVLINIVLYRLHPIIGFLGTLFLFAWMVGII